MASVSLGLRAAACAIVFALAACGTSAGRAERRASPAPAPVPGVIEAGDLRFEALPAQPMGPGACGMFLWGQSAGEPVLVLAAFANPARAHVRVNGRERDLPRTAAEGQAANGQFETQTFSDGRLSLNVDVTFDAARRMRGGAAIERGVIRVVDQAGWETLIPVGGLVGCDGQ